MKVFGLTGGIASGKSTVSRLFLGWGVPVVDADLISREVIRRGTSGHHEVVKHFTSSILQADGELDRKALGRIVFADEGKRRLLNSIVHPRIAERTAELFEVLRAQGERLACYDAPLLIENGLESAFRPVVVVITPFDTQLERVMQRDSLDESSARARIAAQTSQEVKAAMADIIIVNDADLATLESRAHAALDEVRIKVP